ncbi:hypothetical protein DL96DRAFT_1281404 [Flagelloscypha sp. PMI_526]|nr:hypothetical protein DL96DRAFT_1281404 [Flagelloscypha sp. PMI_526]
MCLTSDDAIPSSVSDASSAVAFRGLPYELQCFIFDIAAWSAPDNSSRLKMLPTCRISYESVRSYLYRALMINGSSFAKDLDLIVTHKDAFEKHCVALYALIWGEAYKYMEIWTTILPLLPRLLHLESFCTLWNDNTLTDRGKVLTQFEVLEVISRSSIRFLDLDWNLNSAFVSSSPTPVPVFPSVTHLSVVLFRPDEPPLSILESFPYITHLLITVAENGDGEYQNDFVEAMAVDSRVDVLIVLRHSGSPKPRINWIPPQKVVEYDTATSSVSKDFMSMAFSNPESMWVATDTTIAERSDILKLASLVI